MFSLVNKLKEDVIDRSSNERPQAKEFAVYSMQCGFEKVAFSGILAVE
jgi:hypothetical protein